MTEPEAPKATGQFGPGNKAAAGNHTMKLAVAMKELCRQTLTELEIKQLIRKLYDRAMERPEEGQADIAAARELCDRMYGRPSQAIEHSGIVNTKTIILVDTADPEAPANGG